MNLDLATRWSLGFWLVLGLIPVLPWERWLSGDGAAAWVQAVGSVGAILVAVIVSTEERRHARVERSAAAADAIRLRAGVVRHILTALEHFLLTFDEPRYRRSVSALLDPEVVRRGSIAILEQCKVGLGSFPVQSLSCPEELAYVFSAQMDADRALELMNWAQSKRQIDIPALHALHESLRRATDGISAIADRVEAGLPPVAHRRLFEIAQGTTKAQ
ncbi:MAG: hypothetical protein C0423_01800 [Methylibium sp.]|nr:hypothetical protein [Methylibium sp.]